MDLWLDAVFGLSASAWPPLRRAGRRWRDPHEWADADRSVWTWLAAVGLLLPLVPITVATVHFGAVAWKLSGDDLLWVLGIVLFLPLAAFVVVAACLLASWALTLSFWLLTGREHATVFAGGYLVAVGLMSWPFFTTGFDGYAWALLATALSALLLLLARTASRSGRSENSVP